MVGTNIRGTIYRMESVGDDVVGGAQVTGTLAYSNIEARYSGNMPEQLLLQQGLETVRTFDINVRPGTLDIRERDEWEFTSPYNHPFIEQRFRITGVNYQNFHPSDPRNYIRLSLARSVRSHGSQ